MGECKGHSSPLPIETSTLAPYLDAFEEVAELIHAFDAKRVVDSTDSDDEDVITHLKAGLGERKKDTNEVGLFWRNRDQNQATFFLPTGARHLPTPPIVLNQAGAH